MPYVFSAKTSTDAGNLAKIGADGGIYVGSPYSAMAGLNPAYTLDNSWVGAGQQFWYTLATGSTSTMIFGATASVFPFMFAKSCTVQQMSVNVTAASGSYNLYASTYASNSVTGMPAAKIADQAQWSSAAAGAVAATTMRDTATVYVGRTLYWMAFWYSYGTVPSVTSRLNASMFPLRQNGPPTAVGQFTTGGANAGFPEPATTWAGLTTAPATLAPNTANTVNVAQSMPFIWWQVTNV
jgi:hypothetical protein